MTRRDLGNFNLFELPKESSVDYAIDNFLKKPIDSRSPEFHANITFNKEELPPIRKKKQKQSKNSIMNNWDKSIHRMTFSEHETLRPVSAIPDVAIRSLEKYTKPSSDLVFQTLSERHEKPSVVNTLRKDQVPTRRFISMSMVKVSKKSAKTLT